MPFFVDINDLQIGNLGKYFANKREMEDNMSDSRIKLAIS
jgi:hypothetical protein